MNAVHPIKAISSLTEQALHWYGDLARYTGEAIAVHGGIFYEVELLEGHMKGQRKYTQAAPK